MIAEILNDPGIMEPVLLSMRVLVVSVPALLVFSIAIGYYLGRRRGGLASFVDFVVTLPLVFPPIATGFLLLLILGRRGTVGQIFYQQFGFSLVFSYWGLALAAFLAGLPLAVKSVQAVVRDEISGYVEDAQMLGKSGAETFFRVVLPLLRKGVVIGLFLGTARGLGDVGISLMLGGNIIGRTNTMSLEIYNSVSIGEYDRALILSALLGGASLFMIVLTRVLTKS